MRLRKFATWLFALVLFILAANALILVLIQESYDRVVTAQDHRLRSQSLVDELHRETEQLARLVRAYTATGEPQYLLRYYDILAIRQGAKVAPAGFGSKSYWDDVDAGRIIHAIPDSGPKVSISDFMYSLGFSQAELLALTRILEATAAMTQVEQKAFAAIQGLYDPDTNAFVADGEPRLDYASQLVYSDEYKLLKANLSRAVDGLAGLIDTRTSAEVATARVALEKWILLSLVFMGGTIVMAVVAHRVIRIKVLVPIAKLGKTAGRIAAGNYATVVEPMHGVHELEALGQTVHAMAGAINEDIERRQKFQGELQLARKQAEDATHAKSMFLANMSHEIRTPMNAILGMAYLALGTDLNARQRDYVSKIHEAAKSLLGIINDILDFSKVEADKLVLEDRRFRLEDIAGNALSLLRQKAHEKDIELLFDVSDGRLLGDNCALVGDSLRLGQVLTNLISNSVKFTHKGYVKLAISIEQSDTDSVALRFAVRDTGIGLSPSQIERLFLEFTQADGSTTRKYGGTGLGLTISKRIVELMQGKIWVESVPHVGSSFVFTARFALAAKIAPPEPPLPHIGKMRVLVVDDQPEARLALIALLKALGIGASDDGIVESADDGVSAQAMIDGAWNTGRPYDLLMIDWVMPRLDGAGLLKALRETYPSAIPLSVVISAYDSDVVHETANALGATLFLAKPVLPESLRELIRQIAGLDPHAAALTHQIQAGDSLLGLHILVIEDNPINQQLAKELIQTWGAIVDVAEDGRQGLDLLLQHPPDHYAVVLMDLQMPVLDGYEATRQIRSDDRYVNLPVVAMTAHAMAEERERCLLLGMNGHISKPIDPELLYTTLVGFARPGMPMRHGPTSLPATSYVAKLADPLDRLLDVPQLDTKAGLRHANGNKILYRRLLTEFMRDCAGFSTTIRVMLASDQWEDATRLAHTLKGLCGSLGASQLRPLVAAFESSISRRDLETATNTLAPVEIALDTLNRALATRLPIESVALTDQELLHHLPKAPDLPVAREIVARLSELRRLLEQNDSEAIILWTSIHPGLVEYFSGALLQKTTGALERFEFDRGLDLVDELKHLIAQGEGHSSATTP